MGSMPPNSTGFDPGLLSLKGFSRFLKIVT